MNDNDLTQPLAEIINAADLIGGAARNLLNGRWTLAAFNTVIDDACDAMDRAVVEWDRLVRNEVPA